MGTFLGGTLALLTEVDYVSKGPTCLEPDNCSWYKYRNLDYV
jgi:hypothetical protein